MKVRVLGCHGSEQLAKKKDGAHQCRTCGFLINDTVMVDAGTIGAAITLDAQRHIRHILLSHLHFDHIQGLPTFGDNISDSVEAILVGKRYLIHDRDPLFTAEFLGILADSGVKSVKLPPRSPNLNAYAERFVRTIKESCLDRMILFGEDALRKSVQEFTAHHHTERHHQGLGNRLIMPDAAHLGSTGEIRRRERLGGMLDYYYRDAA